MEKVTSAYPQHVQNHALQKGIGINRELTSGTRFQDTGRSEKRGVPLLQGLMPYPTIHHAAAARHSCCVHHTPPDTETCVHACICISRDLHLCIT